MRNFRVSFLNPPFLKKFSRPQRSPAVTKSGTLYYPMWLAYAAAVTNAAGFEIDLIDAPAQSLSDSAVLERLMRFHPGLVVIETSTPSAHNDVRVGEDIKGVLPGAFVLLVGTHVSALPVETLSLGTLTDGAASGEYDYTVRELAETLAHGGKPESVAGLTIRTGARFHFTGPRGLIEDLDSLPFVSETYRRFLNIREYFNPNALFPMVTITGSRGCPFECAFCVYPQTLMGHKLRLRSVENLLDEVAYIAGAFEGVRSVFFEDDTFTVSKKRCVEFSEGLMQSGLDISWSANARATLDYEAMVIMKKAGCRLLCVGFESGNQKLLDSIRKGVETEQMKEFMESARRAGVLIHGCFMAGLPGETKETLMDTLSLALVLNPDTAQFYPVMVYPGTKAYAYYRDMGLLMTEDYSQWLTPSGLHNTVISTEELSAKEIVQFCDNARRRFYLRPEYLLYKLRQTVTKKEELVRNVKSAKTFLRHLFKGTDIDS